MKLVIYVLVLVAGCRGGVDYTCTPGSSPSGVSLPRGDIFLLQNSSQTLHCLLNPDHDYYVNQGLRAEDLYFWTAAGNLPSRVLNTTAITATFTADIAGVTDVQCLARNKTKAVGICSQRVFSGYLPLTLANFSCISENWHNLNCSWAEEDNPVPTHYEVSFIEPGASSHPRSCPNPYDNPHLADETESEHSCFLDLTTHPPYRQTVATYTFYANGSNPLLPSGRLFPFSVDHFAIVRPGQAVNVELTDMSASQLQLTYSVPNEMRTFGPGLLQRVRYKDEWTVRDEWRSVDSWDYGLHDDDFRITLSHLKYPFSVYTVEIRMISGSADKNRTELWSEPAIVSAKTAPAAPFRSPKVNQGSFEVLETGATRTVFVYWQTLRPFEANGPGFRYVARTSGSGRTATLQLNNTYARFDNISVSETRFEISAVNDVGSAPTPAAVTVPQAEFLSGLRPKSLTKIYRGPGRYEVAWRAPADRATEVVSYTLYWCRPVNRKDRPYQCDGQMDWKVLEPDRGRRGVQTHDLLLPSEDVYQIAVSANTHTLSSGKQTVFYLAPIHR